VALFVATPAVGQSTNSPDAPPAPARAALAPLSSLPRDSNGFLTAAVWDILEQEAKSKPTPNGLLVLEERPRMQAYYATWAGWKAPEPPPVPEGKLRNLADVPKVPRFPLTEKVWPEKAGEAAVCLWEDDKLAAMSLGVDDNNAADIPYWKELSKKYGGLNITWNLITDNIDGTIDKGRVAMAGTWELWQQMLNDGYHLASHSMSHNHDPVPSDGWPGPDWEAAESQHQIDSHLPGHKTRVFVYPGAGIHEFSILNGANPDSAWRASLVKYYAAARGDSGQPNNQANMIDYFNIQSTPVPQNLLNDTNPKLAAYNLNNLFAADPASPFHKFYRGWATTFIHFINDGKDFDTNPIYVAEAKVLAFYNDHRADLWTGFFDDVALYGEERDTATLTTDDSSDAKISLTLTDKMDPATFDYPLTIKVRLPDTWKGVAATQKNASMPVAILAHEGANFALVKAVPDQGQIILTPAAAK